jgi:DNA-binding LacI/PurR family transcriptional regulator
MQRQLPSRGKLTDGVTWCIVVAWKTRTGSLETMGNSSRASLRDVAQLAGVSLATASRALNAVGGRAVSSDLRDAVWQAANELGYRPTGTRQRVSAAAERPGKHIGLILAATYRFADPFWSRVLEGVTEEVLRLGHHISFSLIVDDLEHEHRRRHISAQEIDGLVLLGDPSMVARVNGFDVPEHIVIVAGSDTLRWESDVRYDVITMEKWTAMHVLVQHLISCGRRRLGFVGPAPVTDRRGEGFLHALHWAGLALSPGSYLECGYSTESAYAVTRQFLADHPGQVDGLVCICDTVAIGALRAAKELGMRLPADLAISGYDNNPFSRDLDPPLTTIQVPKELMGELAARRLIERMDHPYWPPIIQLVPTTLVIRKSCGEALGCHGSVSEDHQDRPWDPPQDPAAQQGADVTDAANETVRGRER